MSQKITTLLFDCDNTLVLSESLAFAACADLANEILSARGISDRYTGPELMHEFVGQNFRGMISALKTKYNYEMSPEELESYVSKEEDRVIAKLEEALQPCEGVDPVLESLDKQGKYKMVVVSSSAYRRVKASVEKVGQDKYFHGEIYSAATSLPKPTSKPDPAIYLFALEKLGVKAQECVAIEDSKSGATAAVRAGIPTVGYVGSYEVEERERMVKLLTEVGCQVIMKDWKEFEGILEGLQGAKL
ncbi:HAD superfamily hydrolase protein [Rutstroemia sp. NJR-2017a BBW]|nr:HAD superfamily hydrolase protein [Rutstroemia sp. NJR-2017a BBW]